MTWVAAGIGSGMATMAGVQAIKGHRDQKRDEANRPVYSMPGEMTQNLNQANQESIQGISEQQKQEYLNNLQQGTAYGLSEIGSRNGGLAGVAALNENEIKGDQSLMSADEQVRRQNKDRLMNVRNEIAGYRDKEFEFNKSDPYYEHIARKQARTAALFQNLNNAATMGVGGIGGMGGAGKSSSGTGNNGGNFDMSGYSNRNGYGGYDESSPIKF